MTKEEAYEQNRHEMAALLCPREADIPTSFPLFEIHTELKQAMKNAKEKGVVLQGLTDAGLLMRALCAATQVSWSEPGEGTTRDPVSGKMVPARQRRTAAGAGCAELHELKHDFVAFVRSMAAYAKRTGSPSLAEWREIYLLLVKWFMHHNMINPMDVTLAENVVQRTEEALLALWADSEIEKEANHV